MDARRCDVAPSVLEDEHAARARESTGSNAWWARRDTNSSCKLAPQDGAPTNVEKSNPGQGCAVAFQEATITGVPKGNLENKDGK